MWAFEGYTERNEEVQIFWQTGTVRSVLGAGYIPGASSPSTVRTISLSMCWLPTRNT